MRTFDTTTKALPGTTATITEITEANSVYCPTGTAVPLTVRPGFYTVGGNRTTRVNQEICPMGSYCVNGLVYSNGEYAQTYTDSVEDETSDRLHIFAYAVQCTA